MQGVQKNQNNYEKKNNVRGFKLLDLKIYYKAKVVVHGIGIKVDKRILQWNRVWIWTYAYMIN